MDENELIDKVIKGHQTAYIDFINQYKTMVYKICYSFTTNPQDAEELVQDVFVKAIQNIHSFKGKSKFHTWLYKIAVNECINFTRKSKIKLFFGLKDDHQHQYSDYEHNEVNHKEESHENKLILEENKKQLYHCINQLPKKQKIAFTLHKIDELSQLEVAEIMQLSQSSVESLIHRAKTNLREKLFLYF